MEPNIPVGSVEGVAASMIKAVAGAEREHREGASGKWVAPTTIRGARNLLSVALQYGNAFRQGRQAAALKAADFFGNDDILYLMEDMATGEIRLSILWEWVHKGATLTEDDPKISTQAGDTFTAKLFKKLVAEEYENS